MENSFTENAKTPWKRRSEGDQCEKRKNKIESKSTCAFTAVHSCILHSTLSIAKCVFAVPISASDVCSVEVASECYS